VQSSEIARKCRECADKARALAGQAQTARETRNLLQLTEVWLRLADRFDRCARQPPRSSEDKLFYLIFAEALEAQPAPAVDTGETSAAKIASIVAGSSGSLAAPEHGSGLAEESAILPAV
jgi:hypothetical protein